MSLPCFHSIINLHDMLPHMAPKQDTPSLPPAPPFPPLPPYRVNAIRAQNLGQGRPRRVQVGPLLVMPADAGAALQGATHHHACLLGKETVLKWWVV